MANRSYLYSLSNRPTSFDDRPETVSGISEFAYFVPFSYRVLMSGDPQVCSSLLFDGLKGDPPDKKTKLYAISGYFDIGFNRLKKFFSVIRHLASGKYPDLLTYLNESIEFLEKHYDQYLLLDTFELDIMKPSSDEKYKVSVENEIIECVSVGAAVDSLPNNLTEAVSRLKEASQEKLHSPLDAFYGLRLDDDCDSIRNNKTEYPIGLYFSESLEYIPWNRAEYVEEKNQILDKCAPSADSVSPNKESDQNTKLLNITPRVGFEYFSGNTENQYNHPAIYAYGSYKDQGLTVIGYNYFKDFPMSDPNPAFEAYKLLLVERGYNPNDAIMNKVSEEDSANNFFDKNLRLSDIAPATGFRYFSGNMERLGNHPTIYARYLEGISTLVVLGRDCYKTFALSKFYEAIEAYTQLLRGRRYYPYMFLK